MVTLDKLIYQKCKYGPALPFIPLITAAMGVGASVYTQNKAADAARDQGRERSWSQREAQSLSEIEGDANTQRIVADAARRESLNNEAAAAEIDTMTSMAEQEKGRRELEKQMAAQQGEAQYASKFKPGQGGEGDNSVSDFLVPKIADGAGLVRNGQESGGLNTPLGFEI